MRDSAGIIDLSAFAIFDVVGPGALDAVQRICVSQCDVAVGRVIYTPVLDAQGGFRSDLTVMRLGDDHFRVVTGGAHGRVDRKWFSDRMPADGSAHAVRPHRGVHHDRPVGPAGARHPRRRSPATTSATRASASGPAARSRSTAVTVLASRISYVGELGWELYVPMSRARRLWELLHEAGAPHGAVPVGIGVYGTTGRIEKGYRAYGSELDARAHASSRPACSGPRSRRPTSSAGRPTSSSARRTRRRCCAR